MRQFQRQHPNREYRVLRRGNNYVIQWRARSGSGSSGSETPFFNVPSGKWILVSLNSIGQDAGGIGYVRTYNGTLLIRRFSASGGVSGHTTPVGNFRINYRDRDHRSSSYGRCISRGSRRRVSGGSASCRRGERYEGADMAFYQRFAPQVGFHRGDPTVASHGCIHLHDADARTLWSWAQTRTRVVVCGLHCTSIISSILAARAVRQRSSN